MRSLEHSDDTSENNTGARALDQTHARGPGIPLTSVPFATDDTLAARSTGAGKPESLGANP